MLCQIREKLKKKKRKLTRRACLLFWSRLDIFGFLHKEGFMKNFLLGLLGKTVVAVALFVPIYAVADGGVPAKPEPTSPTAPVIEKKQVKRCIFASLFTPFRWVFCSTARALAYLHNTHPKKFYSVLTLMALGGGAGAYCAFNNCDLSAYFGAKEKETENADDKEMKEREEQFVLVGR